MPARLDPQGRSVMYIVNDVTTSPAWSIKYRSFNSRMLEKYASSNITYKQFADIYNETVDKIKTIIYKELKSIYVSIYSNKCMFRKFSNGINVSTWYADMYAQNAEVMSDLNRRGLKYNVNIEENETDSSGNSIIRPTCRFFELLYMFIGDRMSSLAIKSKIDSFNVAIMTTFLSMLERNVSYDDAYSYMISNSSDDAKSYS